MKKIPKKLIYGILGAAFTVNIFTVLDTLLILGGAHYEINPIANMLLNIHPALLFAAPFFLVIAICHVFCRINETAGIGLTFGYVGIMIMDVSTHIMVAR